MNNNQFHLLKGKILSGTLVLVVRDFGLKILSVLGQIVLVRLIAPEYFGVFAIIIFVTSIAELFSDFGLTQAIIREKNNLSHEQLSTIFFIRVGLSIGAFLLLLLAFPVIKSFYHQLTDENFLMVSFLGLVIVIKSIRGIFMALFDRELNFHVVTRIDLIGIIVYFVTAITLAYLQFFLWNFVIAIFLKETVELLLSVYYKRWIPGFICNITSIRSMIRYGSFLQLGNFILLADKSMAPLVGSKLSAYHIGLLDWSSSVAGLSNTIFENYGRAAFAGIAKIQDRKDKISIFINKSASTLNVFAFLFILLVFANAKEFILLVLTEKWVAALPALYWFAASTIFFGGSVAIAHAILASGNSKEAVVISGRNVLFQLALAFALVNFVGFYGIAIASFFGSMTLFVGYYLYGKKMGLSIELKRTFFDKSIVFLLTATGVVMLNNVLTHTSFITLFIKTFLILTLYFCFLFIFSRHDITEIKKAILIVLAKK